MKILSLDTSNRSTSVSILEDKKSIGKIFLNCGLIHSKVIPDIVKDLLDISSFDIKNIDLLAVCNGPGSFTGIRIGLAFMKGISLSIKKPCIGVSSLESLAYSVPIDDEVIYSCIHANNDEIYFNSYEMINSNLTKKDEDKFIKFSDLTDLVKKEKKNIIFVGNASKTCYNLSSEYLSCDSKFYEKEVDSDFVGQAALDHFCSNDYSLSANYLKKTRAENLKNV